MTLRLAVFASGGGSNLQALIDRLEGVDAPARVALVLSDREDAGALGRAARAGIASGVVAVAGRPAAEVEQETMEALEHAAIDLIALAGYLRLVPDGVVRRYRGRILNIHPALLPAFGGKGMYGMNVHRAVLAAGCRVTGVTVHHVTEEYDRGRPVLQWPVPVLEGDSPESLAARVLRVEHMVYPIAVEAMAREILGQRVAEPRSGDLHFVLADAPAEADVRRLLHPD